MATLIPDSTHRPGILDRLRPAHMGDFAFQDVTFVFAASVLVLIVLMFDEMVDGG